ncbi:MAG: flagellar hook-basal body complex protein FliE [Methylovulum sp.]|nr:flagellar hook-basal body complex protein FliE [Methylovulum sp.]
MSDMNVNLMLAQMRSMSFAASGASAKPITPVADTNFSDLLKQSVDSVNSLQQNAKNLTESFEAGKSTTSIADVMVATQKAGVAFQATLQVRNKLIDAYQNVMNMPM